MSLVWFMVMHMRILMFCLSQFSQFRQPFHFVNNLILARGIPF